MEMSKSSLRVSLTHIFRVCVSGEKEVLGTGMDREFIPAIILILKSQKARGEINAEGFVCSG
jgi:hypothetical protein